MFAHKVFRQREPILVLWKRVIDVNKQFSIAPAKVLNKDVSYVKILTCKYATDTAHRNIMPSSNKSEPELQSKLQDNHTYASILICYNCKKPGHLKRDCPVPNKCYRCGESGHSSMECTTPRSSWQQRHSEHVPTNSKTIVCYKCQKIGHGPQDCPENNTCYVCGKIGHFPRFCPTVHQKVTNQ